MSEPNLVAKENLDSITKVMERSLQRELSKPMNLVTVVTEATDPDTMRASKHMKDEMQKALVGLEKELAEAAEIRQIVNARMTDLTDTVQAIKAMLDVLNNKKK